MHLYGEVSVGCADEERFAGAFYFFKKMHLGIPAADMFKDGVRPADVKTFVREGEVDAVVLHGFNRRI